jgi:hypothetical protein
MDRRRPAAPAQPGTTPHLSDAEQRYLDRVAEDCEALLGPGIELDAIELETDDAVTLRLRYRLGPADWTSEGRGETVVAAHASLREQLVLDRIRVGVRALLAR